MCFLFVCLLVLGGWGACVLFLCVFLLFFWGEREGGQKRTQHTRMKTRISEPINLNSLTSKETHTSGKISEDTGKLTETLLTIAFSSHITSRENGTRFENKAFQLYYA